MAHTNGNDLSSYYQHVQTTGKLRTPAHAHRWSNAVLRTLGISLDRGTRKKLAEALPEELADPLTRVFWLLHFRNPNQPRRDFLTNIAKRGGNTDPDFAYFPAKAVFGGIKKMIDSSLSNQVADSLSPEVRELWQQAE